MGIHLTSSSDWVVHLYPNHRKSLTYTIPTATYTVSSNSEFIHIIVSLHILRWLIFFGSAINWLPCISSQISHHCHKFTIIIHVEASTTFNFRASFLFHLKALHFRPSKNGMIFQFTSNQLVNFEFLNENEFLISRYIWFIWFIWRIQNWILAF